METGCLPRSFRTSRTVMFYDVRGNEDAPHVLWCNPPGLPRLYMGGSLPEKIFDSLRIFFVQPSVEGLGLGVGSGSIAQAVFLPLCHDLHEFVEAMIAVTGKRVWILGHSLMGAVALMMAHVYPNDVAGLILVNSFYQPLSRLMERFACRVRVAEFVDRVRDMVEAEDRIPRMLSPEDRELHEYIARRAMWLYDYKDRDLAPWFQGSAKLFTHGYATLTAAIASPTFDFLTVLRSLPVPVLVLAGASALLGLLLEDAWYMNEECGNVKAYTLYRSGHYPWTEQTDEWLERVLVWMNARRSRVRCTACRCEYTQLV